MKCLTVCQPWAWAIASGLKTIENRTWYTSYRGPIAIHAGVSTKWIDAARGLLPEAPHRRYLEFGAIVAVGTLADCVPVAEVQGDRFASGPWCWLLRDVRPCEPLTLKGRLGLFNLDAETLSRIRPYAEGVT